MTTKNRSRVPACLGRIVVGILLVAGVALGGTASSAEAGKNQSITVAGGQATFQHHGEILTASDTRKDGRCITATIKWIHGDINGRVLYKSVTACGYGTVKHIRPLNFGEGQWVSIQVCYTGGGKADKCSKWQDAVA